MFATGDYVMASDLMLARPGKRQRYQEAIGSVIKAEPGRIRVLWSFRRSPSSYLPSDLVRLDPAKIASFLSEQAAEDAADRPSR